MKSVKGPYVEETDGTKSLGGNSGFYEYVGIYAGCSGFASIDCTARWNHSRRIERMTQIARI